MFLKLLFCRSGLVSTPPDVKNLAAPPPTDIHFDIYFERYDISGEKQIIVLPSNSSNERSHEVLSLWFKYSKYETNETSEAAYIGPGLCVSGFYCDSDV
jgi:hypothetical protein